MMMKTMLVLLSLLSLMMVACAADQPPPLPGDEQQDVRNCDPTTDPTCTVGHNWELCPTAEFCYGANIGIVPTNCGPSHRDIGSCAGCGTADTTCLHVCVGKDKCCWNFNPQLHKPYCVSGYNPCGQE